MPTVETRAVPGARARKAKRPGTGFISGKEIKTRGSEEMADVQTSGEAGRRKVKRLLTART